MWHSLYRGGLVVGLGVLVLVIAGAVVAAPTGRAAPAGRSAPVIRSDVASPIVRSMASAPQAVSIAPNFSVVMSAVVPSGLTSPVGVANAGDGSGRLFIVEQTGAIRVLKQGVLNSTPFFSVTDKISCCGERGLLSVAFDPAYQTNGVFYVYYTALNGDVTIERYTVAIPASDVASIVSSASILVVAHPAGNHNGGQLQFGSDGYLYAGLGDGGGGNDLHGPIGNGQNPAVLLGKILRLNVRGVPTYTIPASNPFTQTVGYRPEIWALGVRNPWRFSFDRGTGDLYIGDVGQNCWEEISYQPASSHGGENYGWRNEEGFRLFDPNSPGDFNCNQPVSTLITTTKPITAYVHPIGSAVTGGYVYRGQQYPWMRGVYFYSDSGSGIIWAVQQVSPGVWSGSQKLDTSYGVTAFGEDESGELYVTDYGQGRLFKITSPSPINFATSSKSASASQVTAGSTVTYTIVVRNTGLPFYDTVRVTDTLPAGLSYVAGSLAATSGVIDASGAPTLKWSGTMSITPTSIVTITFRALVAAEANSIVTNTATIDPVLNPPLTRSATITVTPSGPNLTGSTKQVSTGSARWNDVLTYTIVLRNSGEPFTHVLRNSGEPFTQTVRVTDTVPGGLNYLTGSFAATSGTPDASSVPILKWSGVMSATPVITLTYAVTVATTSTTLVSNTALINPGYAPPFARTASLIVNPRYVFLPLMLHQ
jgi:uncharacterized repeat protein (TIGR01451 family)